jgi:hypothetical protein
MAVKRHNNRFLLPTNLVKSLGPPPIGILQYVDFKYDDKLEQRRLKLDKIITEINESVQCR